MPRLLRVCLLRALLALIGALIGALAPALALADPSSSSAPRTLCSTVHEAWVRALSQDAHTPISLLSCPAGRLIVRLESGAEPMRVELMEGTGPAFKNVPPWRISPMIEVDDFSALPAAQREAFDKLLVALEGRAPADPLGTPELLRSNDGSARVWPWPLALALLCAVGAVLGRHASPRMHRRALLRTDRSRGDRRADASWSPLRTRVALGTVTSLALVLRVVLGSWGPFHVNGQGTLWLDAGLRDPGVVQGYGPGYWELFHVLASVGPRYADLAIFAVNGAMSSLMPVLVFALARLWRLSSWQALAAAVVLALDPVAIRIATTEAYHVPILFLSLSTCGCAAWWASEARDATSVRERLIGSLPLVAAGLIASQLARIHPMSWPLVALSPLAALPAFRMGSARFLDAITRGASMLAALVAAFFVVGGLTVLLDAPVIAMGLELTRQNQAGPGHGWSLVLPALGAPWMLLVVLSVTLARVTPSGLRVLLVASASLVTLAQLRGGFTQSPIWNDAFDRLFLVPPTIAIVLVISSVPQLLRIRSWTVSSGGIPGLSGLVPGALPRITVGSIVALGVLCVVLGKRLASTPLGGAARTTDEHEYAWIRAWALDVDPSCDLMLASRIGRQTFFFPTYLLAQGPSRQLLQIEPGQSAPRVNARPGHCLLYLHGAMCETDETGQTCHEIERDLRLEPVSTALLPARPSYASFTYRQDPIEVGLFRVDPSR